MAKALIFIYILVAAVLLLFLSHSPSKHSGHRHRRLKLRSNFTLAPSRHQSVAFDPLVAELERHREDKEWEKQHIQHAHPEVGSAPAHEAQPEWEDFMDAEDYLNDEDKFNVTNRLILLFPKIDVDPRDWFVTEHELTQWNLQQAQREVLHRTQREMELHDKNHDGFVSFSEYDPPSWVQNADNESFGYDMGWWKEEHFNASDADGHGFLNKTEFNDFLNPSDSENPQIINLLCKQEIRQRDKDGDGKLNFEEYFHGLHDHIHGYDYENADISHIGNNTVAKERFSKLDKDSDGFISEHELEPVLDKLHLSERYYARQQAAHAISEADKDHDGRLTLDEMIENPYAFYGSVFLSDDEDYFHDEFR